MPEDLQISTYKTNIHILRRVAQAFVPYRWQVMAVFFSVILVTFLGLVNPLLIRYIFDDAIGKHDMHLLLLLSSIMIAAPIISGLVNVGQTYLSSVIGQGIVRDLRNELHDHLQQLSLCFFTNTHIGEIQSRLANDISGVQGIITDTAKNIIFNISVIASTLVAMIILSPLLTIISFCLMPFFIWITYKVGRIRRTVSKERQHSLAALTAVMQETLSLNGIMLTKIFDRYDFAQERFEQENQRLTNLSIRQQLIGRWFFLLLNIFFAITPVVIYFVAGFQIITDRHSAITLGIIIAFTTLQGRLFSVTGPISQLLSMQVQLQGSLALFERIFEYLDLPVEIRNTSNATHLSSEQIKGSIAFHEVSFSYEAPSAKEESMAHRPVLTQVSFEIRPGQLAALVGPSGAGKTTVAYLIPRLYDVRSGSIKIDGYNIKDIALSSLAQMVGMVTQETFLFHTSIRRNLLFAKPEASEEEMIEAAKAAAIHERIMELEAGYDTIVGERGYKLSGGEKQRISIARVLLKNPRILILDEATSSLDTHAESLIQKALEPLMRGRTTVAIAHRLSTIIAADIIFVMDKGKIVEKGTHQELLEQHGLYTSLYRKQFQGEQTEVFPNSL
jgi:ATP-binding cassette subfamily B protein